MIQENIVKLGFQIPLDMPQTENRNQVSLPVAGEHGTFFYAIYNVIICNFIKKRNIRYADELQCISQMSMTVLNI